MTNWESQFFERKLFIEDQLISYGFKEHHYETQIENFRVELFVDENQLYGKLVDLDFDEEYTLIYSNANGEFVSKIREQYMELLKDIANRCCIDVRYRYLQSNRVDVWLESMYKMEADIKHRYYFLYSKVLFAQIIEEEQKDVLMINDVSYPLDQTYSDEELYLMIELAYKQMKPNKKAIWVIPANPRMFDLEAAFSIDPYLYWHQRGNVNVGDDIYIYLASPMRYVKYRCRAVEVNLYVESRRSMRIQLIEVLDESFLSHEVLLKYGLKSVRGQRHFPKHLEEYIRSVKK